MVVYGLGGKNRRDASNADLRASNAVHDAATKQAAMRKGGTSDGTPGGPAAESTAAKASAETPEGRQTVNQELNAIPNDGITRSTSETKPDSDAGATDSLKSDIEGDDLSNRRPGESAADLEARRIEFMNLKLGKSDGDTNTKIMMAGGIAVGVWATVLIAQYDATNATAKIVSITVEEFSPTVTGYKKVTVVFDRNNITRRSGLRLPLSTQADKDAFNPCIGDVIQFIDVEDLSTDKEYRIMKSNQNSIELKIPNADLTDFIGDEVLPYTYNNEDGDDFMDVYSSWTNQFADDIAGLLNVIVRIAEEIVTQVVAPVLGGAAGAAAQGFCRSVPILCDGTIWIIIGLILAGLVVFIILN